MRTREIRAEEATVDVKFCLMFPREALRVPVMRRVLGDTLSRLGGDEDCIVEVLDSGSGFDPGKLAAHRRPDLAARPARQPPFRRRQPARSTRPGEPATVMLAAPSALHAARGRFSRIRRLDDAAIARLPESGRGLAIMRACVDNVTLSTGPGRGTLVSLEKRLEWRRDAPLAATATARLRDAG